MTLALMLAPLNRLNAYHRRRLEVRGIWFMNRPTLIYRTTTKGKVEKYITFPACPRKPPVYALRSTLLPKYLLRCTSHKSIQNTSDSILNAGN